MKVFDILFVALLHLLFVAGCNCRAEYSDQNEYQLVESGETRSLFVKFAVCRSCMILPLPIESSIESGLFEQFEHTPGSSGGWNRLTPSRRFHYLTMAALSRTVSGQGARWLACNSPVVLAVSKNIEISEDEINGIGRPSGSAENRVMIGERIRMIRKSDMAEEISEVRWFTQELSEEDIEKLEIAFEKPNRESETIAIKMFLETHPITTVVVPPGTTVGQVFKAMPWLGKKDASPMFSPAESVRAEDGG